MSSPNIEPINTDTDPEQPQGEDPMPLELHDCEILVTPSQHRVITHPVDTASTLQVIAGPGSGKTTTLVYKIAYMIGNLGINPSEILVLSMTNKAVDALQTQLAQLFGKRISIDVTTFHGYAHRCVMDNDQTQENGIQIIEEAGWRTLVHLMGNKVRKFQLVKIVDQIRKDGWDENEAQKLCRRYNVQLAELKDMMQTLDNSNVFIHSDIMRAAKYYIRDDRVSLPYKVVIVDEFQDLYPDIFELVELIAKYSHLIVAGDPYQSIYGFLGSNTAVTESLSKFKPIEKLHLTECFRSTPEIIQASDHMMMRTTPSVALKEISGFKPVAKLFNDSTNQYEWVVMEILRLLEESNGVIEPSDITVLARTNGELTKFKQVLNYYGILDLKLSSNPTWLSGGLFHLIDYLRILYDPNSSNFSVLCTMSIMPGIGPVTVKKYHKSALLEKLTMWDYLKKLYDERKLIAKLVPYVEMIEKTKSTVNFDDAISIFKHLLVLGNELGLRKEISKTIETPADKDNVINQLLDFFENLKLSASFKDEDKCLAEHFLKNYMESLPISKTKASVKLSTIHSAKGLEFPIVFVLDSTLGDDTRMESKKLTYVAMTRAKTLLYMNMMKTDPFSLANFKKKFTSEFFTAEKPVIKGPFSAAFAKEFKTPANVGHGGLSNPNKIIVRAFHTLKRAVQKI